MTTLPLTLAVLVAALAAAAPAAAVNCGDTISVNTSLPADLDCSGWLGQQAIRVTNGATLNGNGHTLIGPKEGRCSNNLAVRCTLDSECGGGNCTIGTCTSNPSQRCAHDDECAANDCSRDKECSSGTTRCDLFGVKLDSNAAKVTNLQVRHFRQGIQIASARTNTVVTGVTTYENGVEGAAQGYGIAVGTNASGATISNSVIRDNHDEGIHFGSGSSGNSLSDSTLERNAVENVYLQVSSGNTLTDLTIKNGVNGIKLDSAQNNVLTDVDISAASSACILIFEESGGPAPTGNVLDNTGLTTPGLNCSGKHISNATTSTFTYEYPSNTTVCCCKLQTEANIAETPACKANPCGCCS